MISMYLPDDRAARRTDFLTQSYSLFLSVRHACLTSSVYETVCRVIKKIFIKMRKNIKKNPKNEGDASPPKNVSPPTESEPETLPEQSALPQDQSTIVGSDHAIEGVYGTVDGVVWPPHLQSRAQTSSTLIDEFNQKSTQKTTPGNSTSTEASRSRSAFTMPNVSQDVRERPEFKNKGWACIEKKKENGWKKKEVKSWPNLKIKTWEERSTTKSYPKNSSSCQRSRSPVERPSFKKPEVRREIRPRSRKPEPVKKVVVERKKKEKVETLAERWARLGGPKEKHENSTFFTQTPQDPAVIGGSCSVGIKVQVRLDRGVWYGADVETGGYLREEFSAMMRTAGLEAELENRALETQMLQQSADAFKEKVVKLKKEDKRKVLALKKMFFDREVLRKKNEKLKKRKNEEKRKALELQKLRNQEQAAAAAKIEKLEKKNRALRKKFLVEKGTEAAAESLKYDTDDFESEIELVDDEMEGDEEEAEVEDTDSEVSDGSEYWDDFCGRNME